MVVSCSIKQTAKPTRPDHCNDGVYDYTLLAKPSLDAEKWLEVDPTQPSDLLITAIRVVGNTVEIDAKGLRNWSKQYTIYGSPVLLAQSDEGNKEMDETIRHIPDQGIETHTFKFTKPADDAYFFHLRELK